MNYYAGVITNSTFRQLDKISSEAEMHNFHLFCYEYPLIFVKREHSIIFFNMRVLLDQVLYDFLYELVKNATKMNDEKGLSPVELFKLLKCTHTREKSRNINLLTDYDRDDERIRDIKRRIKQAIITHYNSLKAVEPINQLGIYEIKQKYYTEQYLYNEIEINEDSPYYNFEINSAIKLLIVNQKDKNKKYATEFIFKK